MSLTAIFELLDMEAAMILLLLISCDAAFILCQYLSLGAFNLPHIAVTYQ